ncbi:MAG: ATP-binding protein [Pseudomonadota bacterium]
MQGTRTRAIWILAWCIITALGGAWLARLELAQLREAFETDARIAHRLLSQRVVQHDAVMAMLMILQPAGDPSQPEQRLTSVYPHILNVQRRDRNALWPDEQLRSADARSRQLKHAVLTQVDFSSGRYQMMLGADPASYLLQIDIRSMVPRSEWPMAPDSSPVRVLLEFEKQAFVLQPGRIGDGGWRFDFRKQLAAGSQPFEMVAARQVGWRELPWLWMAGWALAVAAALAALKAFQQQRIERRRAEDLLRFGQVARLNTLGELAAGMAHELNQPLTAVLAGTQAASRMLQEDDADLAAVRDAMNHAAEQARRAADVVGRMRRAVERPDLADQMQSVSMQDAVRSALYLLEPECRRLNVTPSVDLSAPALSVLAEPVALEQIIHNLLSNALQALAQQDRARTLELTMRVDAGMGVLDVRDNGPGIAADVLPRMFEPFFTTRKDGLGLGLSLCETLATNMGGTLAASSQAQHGAVFTLKLPLATTA